MNQVRQKLTHIKDVSGLVNPDRSWVAANRARLLGQISNTVIPLEKPAVVDSMHRFWYQFRSSPAFKIMRPSLTALTVAVIATGGWIASVSASFNSLPGDRLWAVKRAAQNTEVAVRSLGASNNKKVQLQLNLAKNRVEDIKKAVAQKLVDTTPLAREKAVKDLGVATNDVQNAIKEVSNNVQVQANDATTKDNQLQVVETVKDVAKDTNNLTKELTLMIVSSTAAGSDVTRQVLETVRVVNQTSINAVEVVVRQQNELIKNGGETGAVKNMVSDKVTDLVKSSEALKVPASSEDLKLILSTPTGTATVILPVKNASSTSNSAVEIKKNIDSGNLQEAVNGLRALNENAVTAQQLLVETKTKVEIDKH